VRARLDHADFVVAFNTRARSRPARDPLRPHRQYNQLLRIEEMLEDDAIYAA